MKKRVQILGAGLGDVGQATSDVQHLIKTSPCVYATARLAEQYRKIRSDIISAPVFELKEQILSDEHTEISVLVSGDVGFFSAAKGLYQSLKEYCDVEFYCGINCMQYFFSKIKRSYENIKIVSLHGRDGSLLGAASYCPKVFVLTGGTQKAHDICKTLVESGMGHVQVTAGENLSMEDERILSGTAASLSTEIFSDLTVLFVENKEFADPNIFFSDRDFIRSDIPMTKEEVRFVSLAKLQVSATDCVYDIGAGTGSVSIELAKKARDGLVYAIEHQAEAVDLIRKNRQKLGTYNLIPIQGEAPFCLEEMPFPNKAFIGGSGGKMDKILSLLFEKNPDIRVVINAVTLETLHQTLRSLKTLGCTPEVVCLNVSRAKSVGKYSMMEAQNPIYVITGERG
ncbi:MAG: precorrin-6y C5,15-methyltransferase (decarboxylating) subunit CbiE [Oscillospiraceae bacterium]